MPITPSAIGAEARSRSAAVLRRSGSERRVTADQQSRDGAIPFFGFVPFAVVPPRCAGSRRNPAKKSLNSSRADSGSACAAYWSGRTTTIAPALEGG